MTKNHGTNTNISLLLDSGPHDPQFRGLILKTTQVVSRILRISLANNSKNVLTYNVVCYLCFFNVHNGNVCTLIHRQWYLMNTSWTAHHPMVYIQLLKLLHLVSKVFFTKFYKHLSKKLSFFRKFCIPQKTLWPQGCVKRQGNPNEIMNK